jgi:hypothetical protein
MAETLSEAVDLLLAELEAAGVRSTGDQRTLNPPGALLAVAGVSLDRLAGWTLDLTVYLVAPGAGTLAAYDSLGPLIDPASETLGVDHWDAATVAALDGGDPLPALRANVAVAVC